MQTSKLLWHRLAPKIWKRSLFLSLLSLTVVSAIAFISAEFAL
ncbi:MAG: hypothetical protein AB4368_09405 [Xenococcaceae cyanobacterium]